MPPSNNAFASATAIVGTSGTTTFDITGATSQTDEVVNADGHTVWFYFDPPADGLLTLDTAGTPAPRWDSFLAVYTGGPTVADLVPGVSDDDGQLQLGVTTADGFGTSRLSLAVTLGTRVWIQVDSWDYASDLSNPSAGYPRADCELRWFLEPYTSATAALCSLVELRVYERDGLTRRDLVSATTGAQWTDPLGEIGSASLSVPLLQTIMQSDPTLLDNAIVKIATNLTAGGILTEIFGFLAEGGAFTLIGPNEDADKARSLQCRGLLALCDDWVVYPEGGLNPYNGDDRSFAWMSAETTEWFDVTQWNGTIHSKVWSDYGIHADRYQEPANWPDPTAEWVGAGAHERQYFRTTITVADDTVVRMYCSADENLRVYLDSELIMSNNSHETGYTELNHWRGKLKAGTHTVGIHFLKEFDPSTYASWSGAGWDFTDNDRMIFACYSLTPHGKRDSLLRHSDDSADWLAVAVDDDDRPPTWTAAGILGQLVTEAVARGVNSASRITLNFSATEDTNGDPWPDLHEKSWPVGAKGAQVVDELAELDVDFDMLPDLTLNAYKGQGTDVSGTVALQQGVNILSYKADDIPIIATTLLVRSNDRWTEVTETASEADNDRREAFLESGRSLSRAQAKHLGHRALDDLAYERHSYTAEIIAVAGCVPYGDFGKGDTITGYDITMTPTPLRVISISGATPDDGPIRFTIELEEL